MARMPPLPSLGGGAKTGSLTLTQNSQTVSGYLFRTGKVVASAGSFQIPNDGVLTLKNLNAGTYKAKLTVGDLSTDTEFTVAKKALTIVGLTAISKEWDGTTSAKIRYATLEGLPEASDITVSSYTANFKDADIGDNKKVSAEISISGGDTKNYALSKTRYDLLANITAPKTVSRAAPQPTTPANVAANLAAQTLKYNGTALTLTGTTALTDGSYDVTVSDGTHTPSATMTVAGGNFTVPLSGLTLANGNQVTVTMAQAGYTGTNTYTLGVSLGSISATDATTVTGTLTGITLTTPQTVSMDLLINGGAATTYPGITIAANGAFTISGITSNLANNDQLRLSTVIGGVTVTGTGTVNSAAWPPAALSITGTSYNSGTNKLTINLSAAPTPGRIVTITHSGTSYTYIYAASTFGNAIIIDFNSADDSGATYSATAGDVIDIVVTSNGNSATKNSVTL